MSLIPFGNGERVCLGKALAELEIRLLAVGRLKTMTLVLEPNQDLSLATIPAFPPGLVCWCARNARFALANPFAKE